MPRDRSFTNPHPPDGDIRDKGASSLVWPPQAVSTKLTSGRCQDDTGYGGVNPLQIDKSSARISRVNGTVRFGTPPNHIDREWKDRIPTLYCNFTPGHLSLSLPSAGSSLATLMARTNPGRSEVSIPTFIGELKDLPRLVRQIGGIAAGIQSGRRRPPRPREAGGWYLGYQFGIAPLVSDLSKMLQFSASVDKRLEELRRLQRRGGLSRKRELGSGVESTSQNNVSLNSLGGTIVGRRTTVTKWRRWGSVRWVLDAPIPELSQGNTRARAHAMSLIAGINASGAIETTWNLMPWSWLIDWFSNVDDFLQANNHAVPCHPAFACTMTKVETTIEFSPTSMPVGLQGGGATFTATQKSRVGGSPTFNTNLPLLNGRQWSILGALAIQRYR
ncbi:MAG: putative maturation protein [Alehxovirus frumenticola]|uniref:Maturation protein n=1 Tax=Leviviridae sp. TaxID=2027243 RepID=A0ABY3SV53_9VIRU|nr:MAG: putative maturation protein [Leviviridae sp.]